jgi:hypothetical protein
VQERKGREWQGSGKERGGEEQDTSKLHEITREPTRHYGDARLKPPLSLLVLPLLKQSLFILPTFPFSQTYQFKVNISNPLNQSTCFS